jgi:hypothetical protein
MRDLAPQHEEHWFRIYGKVALAAEAIRFENAAKQLQGAPFYFSLPVKK